MYIDSNVIRSVENPNEFGVSSMMKHYIFGNGINGLYQQWYYQIYSDAYPKPPKIQATFATFYDQLEPSQQSQVKVFDLNEIEPQPVFSRYEINGKKERWESLLPLMDQFPKDKDRTKQNPEMITRIIENGIVYEGDQIMLNSIKDYFRDQVYRYDRFEPENKPTIAEWYTQLSFYDKHIQANVKRFEVKIVQPEALTYK